MPMTQQDDLFEEAVTIMREMYEMTLDEVMRADISTERADHLQRVATWLSQAEAAS